MTRYSTTLITLLVAVCSAATLVAATAGAQRGGGTGTGGGTGAGTGGGRDPIAGTPTSTGAARGGRGSPPRTETSPAAIAVKNAVSRVKAINKAIANLEKTAAKTMPKNLTTPEQGHWTEQSKWIRTVKGRYAMYGESLDTATKSTRDSMDLLLKLTELDEQFVALQVATEEEAAKFVNVSKAAKSRHDAALKALKDIK